MDYINGLFGSEVNELKAKAKVIISLTPLDWRRNKKILYFRRLRWTQEGSTPTQKGLRSPKNICKLCL